MLKPSRAGVRSFLAGGLLWASLAAAPLRGQVVTITATDGISRRPLVGALLSLRDTRGVPVARVLADDRGRGVLKAPAPGRFVARADAIGYRGVTSEPFDLAAGASPAVALTLEPAPLGLNELVVGSERKAVCRLDARTGGATSRLWEEARKALTSTSIVASSPSVIEIASYERRLDLSGTVVTEDRAVRQTGSVKPFVSADPEDLHRNGWVQTRPDGVWYFGPDADLLLSDQFLNDHCFRIEMPRDGLVGLSFEPHRDRDKSDVNGTLWLDAQSLELRRLEFGFIGVTLPPEARGIGGLVEFTRHPTGAWYVQRWKIRMPTFTRILKAVGARDTLTGYREAGGEASLIAAGRPVRPGATTVQGTVFDSVAGKPLAGVAVTLGGGRADTTDAAGRYLIESAGVGTYLVTFDHPRFVALGLGQLRAAASLRRGVADTVDLATPSAATLFRRLCPADSTPDLGAVFGIVLDSATGAPIERSVVTLRVSGGLTMRSTPTDARTPGGSGLRVSVVQDGVIWEVTPPPAGPFHVCGVPRRRSLKVRVEVPGRPAVTLDLPPNPDPLRDLIIRVP